MSIELLPGGATIAVGTEGISMAVAESCIRTSGIAPSTSGLHTDTPIHEPAGGLWRPGRIYASGTVRDIRGPLLCDPTGASTEEKTETQKKDSHT